jgi:hypothetical protein
MVRYRQEDSTKIDIKKMRCDAVDLIHPAEDVVFMTMVMNILVP